MRDRSKLPCELETTALSLFEIGISTQTIQTFANRVQTCIFACFAKIGVVRVHVIERVLIGFGRNYGQNVVPSASGRGLG